MAQKQLTTSLFYSLPKVSASILKHQFLNTLGNHIWAVYNIINRILLNYHGFR